jgi:putative ABC transport system permease protein
MLPYVWRELVRNPRRTMASLVGVALGVGLFSGVLFFVDASGAGMTKRAIAPLALDMQAVLDAPLGRGLRLEERVDGASALRPGDRATFTLTVVNEGATAVHEVVIGDEPPPPLSYVDGTTTLNGRPLPDIGGRSPLAQGLARSGLNLGTLDPGGRATLTYAARANRVVRDVGALGVQGRISSREDVVPAQANAPPPPSLEQLGASITGISGVAAADRLSFVDLPPGSLRAGRSTIDEPVRVFAFDRRYQTRHRSIRVAAGSFAPDAALLSVEAARSLDAAPGETVTLFLPDDRTVALPVSGVTDLARATPLFASRKTRKLDDFLYVPHSVVVSPATFRDRVVPAFRAARATPGTAVRALPVSEVDVLIDRSRLRSDPGRALAQTKAVAEAIERVAPDHQYLIDNISNSLQVARDDARVGKRMFVFLGLPGVVLAAFLAAYAGSILAGAQQRERATLRVRGAHRGHLKRMLLYRTLAFAGAGAVLGVALGFATVMGVLGRDALFDASNGDLAVSAIVGVGLGMLTTALALYVPGRRSLRREISEEQRELGVNPTPAWRRWRLDVALLGAAAVAEVVALGSGAFDAPPSRVSAGEAAALPSRLLIAPVVAWVGGALLAVRGITAIAARVPLPPPPRFGPAVRGILARSLRRRSWALATGIAGVGLVVAFGMNLAVFAATYDRAKAIDARFVVGSDLRVTPSVVAERPQPSSFASALEVPGVEAATPVVFDLENSVLIGPHDQDRKDLAAIDAASFAAVAPLADAFFLDTSAAEAMAALATEPAALLVDAQSADDLSIETGDRVEVLLARGTRNQTLQRFRVVGRFEHVPGFPQGTNVLVDLGRYQAATRVRRADFFLVRTTERGEAGLTHAVAALRAGPGERTPLDIDSTATAQDKDRSTLTALNVHGLVDVNSLYTLSMSAAVIAIFVFGLLLQRRREYVTLLAQGMRVRRLRMLVLGEAALVTIGGLAVGAVVGTLMAHLFVHVLRPLFILDPAVAYPAGGIAVLVALPAAAALTSALIATAALRRLRPAELLRET